MKRLCFGNMFSENGFQNRTGSWEVPQATQRLPWSICLAKNLQQTVENRCFLLYKCVFHLVAPFGVLRAGFCSAFRYLLPKQKKNLEFACPRFCRRKTRFSKAGTAFLLPPCQIKINKGSRPLWHTFTCATSEEGWRPILNGRLHIDSTLCFKIAEAAPQKQIILFRSF